MVTTRNSYYLKLMLPWTCLYICWPTSLSIFFFTCLHTIFSFLIIWRSLDSPIKWKKYYHFFLPQAYLPLRHDFAVSFIRTWCNVILWIIFFSFQIDNNTLLKSCVYFHRILTCMLRVKHKKDLPWKIFFPYLNVCRLSTVVQ